MRQFIFLLALLPCFVFGQDMSESFHEEDVLPLSEKWWPKCNAPKVIMSPTNQGFEVEVEEFDENLIYEVRITDIDGERIEKILTPKDSFHAHDGYDVLFRTVCDNNNKSEWVLPEHVHYSRKSLLGQNKFHSYNTPTKLYLSYVPYADEYSSWLNKRIHFRCEWQSGVIEDYYSKETISELIDGNNDPVVFEFDKPSNNASLSKLYAEYGDIDNCSFSVVNITQNHPNCSYGPQIESTLNSNNVNKIDESSFVRSIPCDAICDVDLALTAERIGNHQILVRSSVDETVFENALSPVLDRVDIQLEYWDAGQLTTVSRTFWQKGESFDPTIWSDLYTNNSLNNEVFYKIQYYISGVLHTCLERSEVPILDSNPLCAIFNELQTELTSDGDPVVTFTKTGMSEQLSSFVANNNISEETFNTLLEGTTIKYEVYDGTDLKGGSSFPFNGLGDLSIKKTVIPFDFVSNKKYNLSIKIYQNGSALNEGELVFECSKQDVSWSQGGQYYTIECGQDYETPDLSSDTYRYIVAGDWVKINNFPLYITSISGSIEQGYSGKGVLILPFEQKEINVAIHNIKVLLEGDAVKEGNVSAEVNVSNVPDFNLPPIYIGGDICVPPPTTGDMDGSGISKTTGLDQYGFNPKTGEHSLGGPYDPNGFDINGNHKDTGGPYNSDGCSRDGILYVESGGQMVPSDQPCKPGGDFSEERNVWVSGVRQKACSLFQSSKTTLIKQKTASKDSIQGLLKDIRQTLVESGYLVYSSTKNDNHIMNLGASANYERKPEKVYTNYARNAEIVSYEAKFVQWYNLDQEYLLAQEIIQKLNGLTCDGKFKNYLLQKIESISEAEYAKISQNNLLTKWFNIVVLNYLDGINTNDIGYLQLDPESIPSLYASQSTLPENSTTSFREDLAFEFEHSDEYVGNIPKVFIAEYIHSTMASNSASTLPLKFHENYGRYDVDVYITGVEVTPTSANMNIGAILTDKKNNNQKIAFGGYSAPISLGSQAQPTKINLLTEVGMRINNMSRLGLYGDGSTYILWGCGGFEGINLNGYVEFCRDYITPLNEGDETPIEDENVLYKLSTSLFVKDLSNIHIGLGAKPFELTNLPGYKFTMDTLILDMSNTFSPPNLYNLPAEYESPFRQGNKLLPQWRGVYAENLSVTLPKGLIKKANKSIAVDVPYVLLDDWGLTTHISVDPGYHIVPYNEGNSNGWQMSLESFNLVLANSSVVGGGFGGKMGLPVVDVPFDYTATFFRRGVTFKIAANKQTQFTPFGLDLNLEKTSYLVAEYRDRKFYAKAHLNGDIASGGKGDWVLPKMKFRGFELANEENTAGENVMTFSAGYWGVEKKENTPLIGKYDISVNSIQLREKGRDTLAFSFDMGVNLIDSTLYAQGTFDIFADVKKNELDVFKINYAGSRLNSLYIDATIKSIFSLKGYVYRFDVTNHSDSKIARYGKGYRGGLDVVLLPSKDENKGSSSGSETSSKSGFSMTAIGQFGSNSQDIDYYFVDMLINTGGVVNIAGVDFTEFGGGIYSQMSPDYSEFLPSQTNIPSYEVTRNKELGFTLSGIKYVPDSSIALGLKFMTKFKFGKEELCTGMGELDFNLNQDYSLNKIALRAKVEMLKDVSGLYSALDIPVELDSLMAKGEVDLVPKPKAINASIAGFAAFDYDFTNAEFKGNIAAYVNTPKNVLKGGINEQGAAVMVDIYFGKSDWWIYFGEPDHDRRMSLELRTVVGMAELSAYLNAGTKIPPFPGLPEKFKEYEHKIGLSQMNRGKGAGFAFGAALHLDYSTNSTLSLNVSAEIGFDLMLRKYNDIQCAVDGGTEIIGMNGWYTMGQAWAYIDGSFNIGPAKIFEGGVATLLHVRAPNPTYIYGLLKVKVGRIEWEGDIEIGSVCTPVTSNSDRFSKDLVLQSYPNKGELQVERSVNPTFEFILPLNSSVKNFTFENNGSPETLTFDIDIDSSGIFYADGTRMYNQSISFDALKQNMTVKPTYFLESNEEYFLNLKIDIYRSGEIVDSQRKSIPFKTQTKMDRIYEDNIAYAYPVDGMYNFYPKELTSERGYIKLIRSQYELFNDYSKEIRMQVVDTEGQVVIDNPTEYTDENAIIFDLPANLLQKEQYYRLNIVQKDVEATSNVQVANRTNSNPKKGKIIYSQYFRVSKYASLDEKLSVLTSNSSSRSILADTDNNYRHVDYYKSALLEGFDQIELNKTSGMISFLNAIQDPMPIFQFKGDTHWPYSHSFNYVDISENYKGINVTPYADTERPITEAVYNQNSLAVPSGNVVLFNIQYKGSGDVIKSVRYTFPNGMTKNHELNIVLNNRWTYNTSYGADIQSLIENELSK